MLSRSVRMMCVAALATLPAFGQGLPGCNKSELACVLDAAWAAALVLPAEKQNRLKPVFVTVAARGGDPALMQAWANRLGSPPVHNPEDPDDYIDFGWQRADKVLSSYGVEGLIRYARERREPLHVGRGDTLLSAGKHLYRRDLAGAAQINRALLDIQASASDFEAPDLADAAAELAMYRCDLRLFDEAVASLPRPATMRHAFWRGRITGDVSDLLGRVVDQADTSDTRHVRQVLDGYSTIIRLGYCQSG